MTAIQPAESKHDHRRLIPSLKSAEVRATGSTQLKYYWIRIHELSSQSRGQQNNGGTGGRCENGGRYVDDLISFAVQSNQDPL
jgi:hypothetical protein